MTYAVETLNLTKRYRQPKGNRDLRLLTASIPPLRQSTAGPLIITLAIFLLAYIFTHRSFASPIPIRQSSSVTIVAVGDTNGYNILQWGRDEEDPLREVKGLLKNNDIFIFNFEGVLLSKGSTPDTCRRFPEQSLFYSPSRIADYLRPTQLTIATLANNHILDCGRFGVWDTIHELSIRGIKTLGAGENLGQACKPIRLQVNGIRLAIINYLAMKQNRFSAGVAKAGAASWKECLGRQQFAEIKASGDILVVVLHLHLGQGWSEESPPDHIVLVKQVLAAGADVVIAHGPHVPQGVFQSNGSVALLSLGNFLFRPDYQMPKKAHHSIMARMGIFPNGLTLSLLPLRLDDSGRPRVPRNQEAYEILRDVAALSARLGTAVQIRGETGYVEVKRQR